MLKMDKTYAPLEQVYLHYRDALQACERQHKPTDGLFGFGHSIKDDGCHDHFDDQLAQAVASLTAQSPSSEEAEAAIRLIFSQTSLYAYPQSAQWMLFASERHILALIPFLTEQAAARLCAEYGKRYHRWERLPVQQEVYRALRGSAHPGAFDAHTAKRMQNG